MEDKKSLEEEYIASYHYSSGQKFVAITLTIMVVLGMITALAFLTVNVVNLIVK